MTHQLCILLIDDEALQLESLRRFLERREYTVYTSTDGKKGLELLSNHPIDLVFTDLRMPGWDGQKVLHEVKSLNPQVEVVVMTAYGNIDDAVTIMKNGAYDYLTKPVDLDELETVVERVLEKRILVEENRILREQLRERYSFDAIISRSGAMEEVLNTTGRVAKSSATVLIRGESGTGKELIARTIHQASDRKDQPFVTVNVAALPDTLLESELFGHEKGAFTGANDRRIGRFEEASGGTLFIDEVGEILLTMQAKLLRAIQFGQIQRLGSNTVQTVDVRIVAATHRNLEQMLEEKTFREDLYYRLNVVSIWIPPLRKRKADIPALVNHFIDKYTRKNGREVDKITRDALDQLMKYHFPGNVRELENMIERAIVLGRHSTILPEDLPTALNGVSRHRLLDPTDLDEGYPEKMTAFETALIQEALKQTGGNQSAAARKLGISERHIRSRLERLGLKESGHTVKGDKA